MRSTGHLDFNRSDANPQRLASPAPRRLARVLSRLGALERILAESGQHGAAVAARHIADELRAAILEETAR